MKSTTGVDTGCCVLVVQWKERERGLKYLLSWWNLQKGVDTGVPYSKSKRREREQGRFEKYT